MIRLAPISRCHGTFCSQPGSVVLMILIVPSDQSPLCSGLRVVAFGQRCRKSRATRRGLTGVPCVLARVGW